MKRAGIWAACLLLALALGACGQKEPDPRDIDPEDVAFIISGNLFIEDSALIQELTEILNTLDPERGVYDERAESRYYRGHAIAWYDENWQCLAGVDFWNGKVYRDGYCYNFFGGEVFDLEALDNLTTTHPEGVHSMTILYPELMWGADRLWVENLETGYTAVVSKSELLDELTNYFEELRFQVEEECPPDAEFRFRVRWTYTETDDLLEEMSVGADGRILRHEYWCSVLRGSLDTALLEALTDPSGEYAGREEVAVFSENEEKNG